MKNQQLTRTSKGSAWCVALYIVSWNNEPNQRICILEIKEVANKYLKPNQRVEVEYLPKKEDK